MQLSGPSFFTYTVPDMVVDFSASSLSAEAKNIKGRIERDRRGIGRQDGTAVGHRDGRRFADAGKPYA